MRLLLTIQADVRTKSTSPHRSMVEGSDIRMHNLHAGQHPPHHNWDTTGQTLPHVTSDSATEPVKAFQEALAGNATTRLYAPLMVHCFQSEVVGELRSSPCEWQVLFIGKHQQHSSTQLFL
mmetsp:Transcript_50320/g.133622  ORF Transcript_50320/g.133622 Transcript_50320/m.133622 type:complete len:121 (+) Transcript_50320:52-414(+)